MAATSQFQSLTPMIPAGESVAEALAYFTAKLGFTVVWQDDDGAGVKRGAIAFNLVRNTDRHWAENCSCSIAVSDLDALHGEYRGVGLRLGALDIKPWGRREFHMILPTGVCLQFYQSA